MNSSDGSSEHLLWQNISQLPYFRGYLRAIEAGFYRDLRLQEPILDLGCGDGHFASVALQGYPMIGLDPERGPLQETARRGNYQALVQAAGGALPFPGGYFSTIISNSVLEHIEGLDAVLAEVSRALKSGGAFLFCVPNDRFLQALSISKFFDWIHCRWLGDAYRRFFNTISRHRHCDDLKTWKSRLSRFAFRIQEHWDYFSEKALHILEWGHYFGLPSLLWKKLAGKWVIVPSHWNLFLVERALRKGIVTGGRHEKGVYSFFIAVKNK
jgi:SAM-dependent methyltransferase